MKRWSKTARRLTVEALEPRQLLTATTVYADADYTLKIDDSDRFAIMEVSAAEYDNWYAGAPDPQAATDRIMGAFDDAFDFLLFVNKDDASTASYYGKHWGVLNDTDGLGKTLFDASVSWGSTGRLQSVIHLTRQNGIIGGPSLHEIMHRWGNSLSQIDGGVSGHWGYSNIGGQLGGWQAGTLVDLGNGTYDADGPRGTTSFGTFANGGNGLAYSPLELYLMGLIPPSEVTQDLIVAQDAAWADSANGIFSASGLTTFSINDIIAEAGPRVPDAANSQKQFRALVVAVTPAPLTEAEQEEYATEVERFGREADDGTTLYNFWEATGGRASIQMDEVAASLVDPNSRPQGTIAGQVWSDDDASQHLEAGESGVAGHTVYLDLNQNGVWNQQQIDYPSHHVPLNTVDQTAVVSTLNIIGVDDSISDLEATLQIDHPQVQHLSAFLTSPAGTRVELFSGVGQGGPGFAGTTFDDQAGSPITSAATPFSGTYRPQQSLAALNGEDPNGEWTLEVADSTAGDAGQLVSWSIRITSSGKEPAVTTDAAGQYTLENVPPGTYQIRQTSPHVLQQTYPSAEKTLLVTEADVNSPDWVEIQNTSDSTLNTSGWVVAIGQWGSDINELNPVVWELPATLGPQEVLYRTDSGDNYWGSNINWADGGRGWVMILDHTGRVMDWVGWGWSASDPGLLDVTVNGFPISGLDGHWTGPTVPSSDPLDGQDGTIRRVGGVDTDSQTDWEWGPPNALGQANPDLVTPVAGRDYHLVEVRRDQTSTPNDFGVQVDDRLLVVENLLATPSGFAAVFNRPPNPADLNLYDTQAGVFGPADVTLVGDTGGDIPGSLVVDGTVLTFIATGGPLAADRYTVTLRSGANGLRDLADEQLLDGNGDGTPGDNFEEAFTVGQPALAIISLPDFSRGPGQEVDVPAQAEDLPLTLSNGSGVTSLELNLAYNPALLAITEAVLGPDAPAGAALVVDTSVVGVVTLSYSHTAPLAAGASQLISLRAEVPPAATYGAAHVLDISNATLNGGSIAVTADDAIHATAFLGDATGNREYSGLDAQRVARVAVNLDGGFADHPLIDPVVIADATANGELSGLDAQRIAQEAVGLNPIEIPPIPQLLRLAGSGSRGPQAFMAASAPSAERANDGELSADDLAPVVVTAVARLESAEDTEPGVLRELTFEIVDLPGDLLGRTLDQTVQIDINAAGFGWFVDQYEGQRAKDETESAGLHSRHQIPHAVDLLTVVLHELGHVLGHDHEEDGIMQETLPPGIRRVEINGPGLITHRMGKLR